METAMPQDAQERIARHLRPELENVGGLKGDEIDAVVGAFTVLESSAPHSGHIQYRLTSLRPEIERRSDIQTAISRAIHDAGYFVAGEE